MKIALSVKVKNGVIYKYMKENNLTCVELSRIIGINVTTLYSIINFRWKYDWSVMAPRQCRWKQEKLAKKLEDFFDMSIEEIYPTRKEAEQLIGEKVLFKDVELIPLECAPQAQISYNMESDREINSDDLDKIMATLRPSEESVLRLRYGLGTQ